MHDFKQLNPPVELFIGYKIKTLRTILAVSQEQLAAMLGLTFQQVQKYEKGINRVAASTLYKISEILGVNISYFFQGLEESQNSQDADEEGLRDSASGYNSTYQDLYDSQIDQKEVLSLIRAYRSIENSSGRNIVYTFTKSLSKLLSHRD